MSLNVSSRSNLSNQSYNPNLIKHDKNLLKNRDLIRIFPQKYSKSFSSSKSDETEDFLSNDLLSENWLNSVKEYNLENLENFPYSLIPINFEDFKFQNLKERIKIIEIRNRKNSTQSSKTLNQIGSDNLFDKIDTTLEDSLDRSSSLKNFFTKTQFPSKQPVNSLSSEPIKTQQNHPSKYEPKSVFKHTESKVNYSSTEYKKLTKKFQQTGVKNSETKINLIKPSNNNLVNININEFKKNSKIIMNRPLYRVPKYGPLKLSSQELLPEVYSIKNKAESVEIESDSSNCDKLIDHKFDPYSILPKSKPNVSDSKVNDNPKISHPSSSNSKSFIVPSSSSQPSNDRPSSYPQSNISSISTNTSKISINIDEIDRTALKLKYINKFKEDNDNKELSSLSMSESNNKTSLQDKMSVIFTDKPKPCLVLSDYSSSSADSLNFTQDLPQFLKVLNFQAIDKI